MIKRLLAAAGTCAAILSAASPASWELNTYQDFSKGRFENCSLRKDGRVQLGPKLEPIFDTGQQIVWSVARAADGTTYAATGHKGRLYRIDHAGKGELIWTSDEPEIFAVAVDAAGRVYAGTSPSGKIYRIENGKGVEYFKPEAKFIWSLAVAKDGSIFAGTGDGGRIYRVTGQGQGEIYYETGQAHVTSLAFDSQGRLLAGSEPNGILYRVTAKDRAFVLLDANFPEIRAILPAPDGVIYAAAMGGSVGKQSAAAASQQQSGQQPAGNTPTVTTTITVTDEAAQAGPDLKPKQPQPAQSSTQPAAATAAAGTATSSVVDFPGMDKSAILKIHPDNTVETVWISKEENAYDISLDGTSLHIATDNNGRLYRLEADRKVTLLAETRETEVTRLLPVNGGVVVATGELGKLMRLPSAGSAKGEFESPVHDANNIARWGQLSWRADSCSGCAVSIRTRSGNSARPDKTWSEWSEPLTRADGSQIVSPNARYVQWKAELSGTASAGPSLDSVRLAYLPQNNPPVVKSVTVSAQVSAATSTKTPAAQPTASYSITVTDTGETSSSAGGTATQPITRAANEQLVITWTAEDPDSDKLTYSLLVKGEGESAWIPLKQNVPESNHLLDAEQLADGRYVFRVVASDKAINPPGQAREGELLSAPVLIDRTPPVVRAARNGSEIRVEAADAGSPLRFAEYSINAGPWTPLAAADGVIDSRQENFTVNLDGAAPGPRVVAIRVYDSANNAGVARVTLE